MHLVSAMPQVITVAGEPVRFQQDETLHTGNFYKYTVGGFQALARHCGFDSRAIWTDHGNYFSVHYLEGRS